MAHSVLNDSYRPRDSEADEFEEGSEMQQSPGPSQVRAAALLDAYIRNDDAKVRAIGAEAHLKCTFSADDPAESERLELISGIAFELQRSAGRGDKTGHPYINLLLHLVHTNWIESGFVFNN